MTSPRSTTAGRPASRSRLERLTTIYLAGLVLIGLGARLIGERFWLTTLLAYAPQFLFLIPGALLLPFVLWKRRRAALAKLGGALLVYLLLDGWRFSLPSKPATSSEVPLRLLTYNIRSGGGGVEKLAAAIRTVSPDAICLQEASPYFDLPDPMPPLQKLLPEWRFTNYGDMAIGVRGGEIEGLEVVRYPVPGSYRAALLVRTTLKGQPLTLVTTHLATAFHGETITSQRRRLPRYLESTGRARHVQLDALLARTDRVSGPLILCGDFNTPPRGVEYARLAERFTDAFAATGNGFGWSYSAKHPLLRIDYIWCNEKVRPIKAKILDWPHSDHKPLLADLALTARR